MSAEERVGSVRMVVCKTCGAVVPYNETRAHTGTHK